MAGLTKEQRLAREAEKEAKLTAEIEARVRAEYEARFSEIEKRLAEQAVEKEIKTKEEDKKEVVKRMQAAKRIPLDTIVPVVCNTLGGAIYVSKKTMGYTVTWEDLGSVEYMELGELASMKNTDKRFFEDNWVILEDADDYTSMQLYDFLKVTKYYKNIFTPENLDEVFTYDKEKLIKTLATLSRGMKETIAVRAKQKLDDNTLDKNIVDTLESILGIQFTI